MTGDPSDMSTPVTRGELREELAQLEHKFDRKLDLWGGALLARITSGEQRVLDEMARRDQRLLDGMARLEQRLLTELGRHTQAVLESMTKQISVVDEKYKELPARVAAIEDDLRARKRRRRGS